MKVIGFLGRKQSGKNTCSNIIHGYELLRQGMIHDFKIDNGKLIILTENATGETGWGEFDVTRKDENFVTWADMNMWPFVKNYAFADELKRMSIELFDIPYECVYGTDEQKNQIQEHLRWENMPNVIDSEFYEAGIKNHYGNGIKDLFANKCVSHDDGPMTAREFMQFFGSEIMRKMYGPVWINKTLRQISREQSAIAIISDVRFPNEAEAIKKAGGIIVKLHRKQKTKDLHQSELGVDLVDESIIDYNIQNNKRGSSLDDLQQNVKQIYDTVVL